MDSPIYLLVALTVGLAAGFGACWLAMRARIDSAASGARAELQGELAAAKERASMHEASRGALATELEQTRRQATEWRDQLDRTGSELAQATERASGIEGLRKELEESRRQTQGAESRAGQLASELADTRARLETEQKQSEEKLAVLQQAREDLTGQFKLLASEILDEKSKKFSELNQASLGQLLDPLKIKITEFQAKVDDVYVKESNDRSALKAQVLQLMDLNRVLSEDAQNLTKALKGSNKAQGNWGEMVLEKVLEASGLRKNEEYVVQENLLRDDGSRAQPDVVIRLPENRHIVIDAKVSLVAYEEVVITDDDAAREAAIKRHLDSVRAHMKGLSERNYQSLYGIGSLDFVLMFLPIEPAFMLAISRDRELFMDAWSRNVLLVSPSTLLFVVRTVAHLWRQEAQTRNAQEIAKRGAELYDKLVGFVDDLDEVGQRLEQARKSFSDAKSKLSVGRGNVIRQAEMLKKLGVKPTKGLPKILVEDALESDELDAIDVGTADEPDETRSPGSPGTDVPELRLVKTKE